MDIQHLCPMVQNHKRNPIFLLRCYLDVTPLSYVCYEWAFNTMAKAHLNHFYAE